MEVAAFSSATGLYSGSTSDVGFFKNEKLLRQSWVAIPRNKRIGQSLRHQVGFVTQKKSRFVVLSSQQQQKDVPVVESRQIDDIYDILAERILITANMASDPNQKFLVGLVGSPGAGKSTLSAEVVKRVNMMWPQRSPSLLEERSSTVATVLPMDGFHLYRSQLDQMENPEEAYARRGAPWTFDPARLLKCLKELKTKGSVSVPSFNHGVGDPVEDDIFVGPEHKIVIVEGNYLFHDEGVWKEIAPMFDEKWFVELDIETSMQRVLKRHIATGKAPLVAQWRIDYNDRPNAELINKSKKYADLVIKSVEDKRFC